MGNNSYIVMHRGVVDRIPVCALVWALSHLLICCVLLLHAWLCCLHSLSMSEMRGGDRLDEMVLDLGAGDDEAGFMRTKMVTKWDHKRRNFVTQQVGGDPYKKQRNEAGELIRAKDQPALYEKWKRLHQKSIGRARDTAGDDGEESGAAGESARRPRGGSAGARGRGGMRGRGGRGGSGGGAMANRGVRSELKNVDQLRHERKQKEKRKFQQGMRGRGRGGSRGGSRGGGRGGGSRGGSRGGRGRK